MKTVFCSLVLLLGMAAHAKTYSVPVTADTCEEAEFESDLKGRHECEQAAPDNQCEKVGEPIRGEAKPCEMIVTYIGIQ